MLACRPPITTVMLRGVHWRPSSLLLFLLLVSSNCWRLLVAMPTSTSVRDRSQPLICRPHRKLEAYSPLVHRCVSLLQQHALCRQPGSVLVASSTVANATTSCQHVHAENLLNDSWCGAPGEAPLVEPTGQLACDCAAGHAVHVGSSTCHPVFYRGPCPAGQLFIYNSSRSRAECRLSTCPEGHVMWRAKCQPLGSVGCLAAGTGRLAVNEDTLEVECRRNLCVGGRLLLGNKCYPPYSRGPCRQGHVIVPSQFGATGYCTMSNCSSEDATIEWSTGCWRLGQSCQLTPDHLASNDALLHWRQVNATVSNVAAPDLPADVHSARDQRSNARGKMFMYDGTVVESPLPMMAHASNVSTSGHRVWTSSSVETAQHHQQTVKLSNTSISTHFPSNFGSNARPPSERYLFAYDGTIAKNPLLKVETRSQQVGHSARESRHMTMTSETRSGGVSEQQQRHTRATLTHYQHSHSYHRSSSSVRQISHVDQQQQPGDWSIQGSIRVDREGRAQCLLNSWSHKYHCRVGSRRRQQGRC